MWLNRFTGFQPSHQPQKLCNQIDTHELNYPTKSTKTHKCNNQLEFRYVIKLALIHIYITRARTVLCLQSHTDNGNNERLLHYVFKLAPIHKCNAHFCNSTNPPMKRHRYTNSLDDLHPVHHDPSLYSSAWIPMSPISIRPPVVCLIHRSSNLLDAK